MQVNVSKGFDKKNLKVLREVMNAALAEAGFEGLSFEVGNAKYEQAEANFQVKVKIEGLETVSDKMLEAEVRRLGLVMEKEGRKLIDYKPRNHKYPFIMEDGGKRYKLSGIQARAYFGA